MGWFYATEEGECTIVVYSIDEFISSQVPRRPHFQLGRCYTLLAQADHVMTLRSAC